MVRTRLNISGMNCAACQAHVQNALRKTPGVTDAAVNLMTQEATVDYDPAAVTPERLVRAVKAPGYGAELPAAEDDPEERDRAQHAEYVALRRRAVVSLVA